MVDYTSAVVGRPRSDLDQFKPVQPSPKFEFPQIPIIQKPVERVIGFFQQKEPDRNIIPPPLHMQLKKATQVPIPNGPGLSLPIYQSLYHLCPYILVRLPTRHAGGSVSIPFV